MTAKTRSHERRPGFEVTCVIGEVVFGEGEESPIVAAYRLIAEHDAPGQYRFPREDGTTEYVTVEYR